MASLGCCFSRYSYLVARNLEDSSMQCSCGERMTLVTQPFYHWACPACGRKRTAKMRHPKGYDGPTWYDKQRLGIED
jgi:predicted RNA-binding Zn-ribbon protein involved in translation (DUF1610 family)